MKAMVSGLLCTLLPYDLCDNNGQCGMIYVTTMDSVVLMAFAGFPACQSVSV